MVFIVPRAPAIHYWNLAVRRRTPREPGWVEQALCDQSTAWDYYAWAALDGPTPYYGHAAYQIRIAGQDTPATIGRLLGSDKGGLLCIGQTSEFESRRRKFVGALRRGRRHSEANLLHILEAYTSLPSVYPGHSYEYSYVRLETQLEAKALEASLVKEYVARFGEPPPLNSNIPGRYNWEAWRAVSRRFTPPTSI